MGVYLVPKIGTGTMSDPWRPKYIGNMAGVRWAGMDLGIEPTFLVVATLTAAQELIVAQPDAVVVPPLDTAVGGNPTLNQTRNNLEQRNVPGSWIVATTLWRQVVGEVSRNCLILQRLEGNHRVRLFEPGVSLDSQPSAVLFDLLVNVGQSFSLTTSALAATITVRDNLRILTAQLPPLFLGGETF